MLWQKICRVGRLSWPVFTEWALGPIFNRGLILAISAPAVTLMLYRYFFDYVRVRGEIEAWIIGLISFAGSYLFYLFIGVFSTPVIAWMREKEKGSFFGQKFVYHDPCRVYTTIMKPEDHGKKFTFVVKDAEPNSLVCFDFKYRGGLAFASISPPQGYVENSTQAAHARKTQLSLRVNERHEANLMCCTAPYSDDTQIRVYMLSWDLAK